MPFRFSLETALRYRRSLERKQEAALQAINHQIEIFARQLESMRESELLARTRTQQKLEAGLSSAELQFQSFCISQLQAQQQVLITRQAQARELHRKQLALLTELRQDRARLESVRDRELEIYIQQQSRREQRRA